jgi:hypothetical protein
MMNRGPGFFAAPLPPPSPLSRQQLVSLSQSSCMCNRSSLLWKGRSEEPNYTTARRAWPSINHSIFSAVYPLPFLQCPTLFFFSSSYITPFCSTPPLFFYPFNFKLLPLPLPRNPPEAEFLDDIGARVLKVFPHATHCNLY